MLNKILFSTVLMISSTASMALAYAPAPECNPCVVPAYAPAPECNPCVI